MSDEEPTRTVYTQDLIEISLESNENLDVLVDLVKDKVNEGANLRSHKDQKEVIISKTTLDVLLSLVVANHAATSELNSFSYSLSLH